MQLLLQHLAAHDVPGLGEVSHDVQLAQPLKLCRKLSAALGVIAGMFGLRADGVVPLLPYSVAVQHAPLFPVVLVLAAAGFFLPDLVLRSEVGQRREALFLDLPEAVSVMGLSLRAGQSLRQALELAARDCPGPLGEEATRALSLARRDRSLGSAKRS